MTITNTDPAAAPLIRTDPPRCQGMLECVERCCDPVPCPRPATARVSFACLTPDCPGASHVLLLCGTCADHADTSVPAPTRRPL